MNMQCAVKEFVEKQDSGLYLIDMPTGTGKTFGARSFIEDFIINGSKRIKKIYYITPLKKNINDIYEELKGSFEEQNKLQVFNENVLWLKPYVDGIIDNWSSIKEEIPLELRKKDSYKNLSTAVLGYETVCKSELTVAAQFKQDIIRMEQEFRSDLKSVIGRYKDKNILNTKEYSWVKKLYPSSIAEYRKVVFLTMDKFYLGNDPIVGNSYRFIAADLKDSLVFIDEFDATKDTLLNQMIKYSTTYKLDLFKLFRNICSALKNNHFPISVFSMPKNIEKNGTSLESFKKLQKVFLETDDKYNLAYMFKLDNPTSNERCFLFDDYKVHTITSAKDKEAHIVFENSKEKEQNIIKISNEATKETMFNSLLFSIKGAISYFVQYCATVARNYKDYYDERAKETGKEKMEIEQSISTILDPFSLDDDMTKTLTQMIIDDYNIPKENRKVNIFEDDFYLKGFRFYDFKDDVSHDTSTKIETCFMDSTPEKYLLSLSSKTKVVGLSATASIKTVTGNYNLEYLKAHLKENYYIPSEETRIALKEEIKSRLNRDNTKSTCIKTVDKEVFEITDAVDLLFNDAGIKEIAEKKLQQYGTEFGNKGFDLRRFVKVLLAIKHFMLNHKAKSMLVITNKNIRKENELYSISSIESFIQLIQDELSCSRPQVFALYGESFDSQKVAYQAALKKKEKVVLFSSYPAVGTGQNLQYQDEEEGEEDINYLYIEKPTHIIMKSEYLEDEECLLKFIYQISSMRENNELVIKDYNVLLNYALKKYSGGKMVQPRQITYTYNTKSANNHAVKILIQAVGRICRTKRDIDKTICVDEEIYKSLSFEFLKHEDIVMRKEFEKLMADGTCQKIDGEEYDCARSINTANNKNDKIGVRLDRLLSDSVETWKDENIKIWKAMREFVLKHPTIDDVELNSVNSGEYDFSALYFHSSNGKKISSYVYDREKREISFISAKNNTGTTYGAAKSKLIEFMQNAELKAYFSSEGYATKFEPADNILLPEVLERIYQGALGEVVGKYIFEKYHVELEDISDNKAFEKFDYRLKKNPNVYVDFKNWSDTFDKNFDDETKKVKRKLELVNGKKAFYINVLHNDLLIKPLEFVTGISTLMKVDGNMVSFLDTNDIKKIVELVLKEVPND